MLDAVRVVRPRVALTRNADGTYNIQDVIDRIMAAPPGPPPRFSVNNIEIDGGAMYFDDKPHKRVHEVTGIGMGIPFLSSLPYAAEIRVTPRLAAVVNGSAFALSGSNVVAVHRRQGSVARSEFRCAAARALHRVRAAAASRPRSRTAR